MIWSVGRCDCNGTEGTRKIHHFGGRREHTEKKKKSSTCIKSPVEEKAEWLHSCIWSLGCAFSTKTFELAVNDFAQGAEAGQPSCAGSLPWFSVEQLAQAGFCLSAVSFFLMLKFILAKPL